MLLQLLLCCAQRRGPLHDEAVDEMAQDLGGEGEGPHPSE